MTKLSVLRELDASPQGKRLKFSNENKSRANQMTHWCNTYMMLAKRWCCRDKLALASSALPRTEMLAPKLHSMRQINLFLPLTNKSQSEQNNFPKCRPLSVSKRLKATPRCFPLLNFCSFLVTTRFFFLFFRDCHAATWATQ